MSAHTPPQQHPKLAQALDEINRVLDRHDIAGLVVLHAPGQAEYLLKINPTYSCADFEGDSVRFRALAVDFNGDTAARDQAAADTTNMFALLADVGMPLMMSVVDVAAALDAETGAVPGEALEDG